MDLDLGLTKITFIDFTDLQLYPNSKGPWRTYKCAFMAMSILHTDILTLTEALKIKNLHESLMDNLGDSSLAG